MPSARHKMKNTKINRLPKDFFGDETPNNHLWEAPFGETSTENLSEPLTAEARVDRLFDQTAFPAYQEIVEIIRDAEFDTLNFPAVIAKRHGKTYY